VSTNKTAARNRRGLLLALVAVCPALGSAILMLSLAPAASAGEWVQRSCSYNGEYIAPEGWEAKAYYGYSELPHAYCEKVAEGSEGGLTVYATPYNGDHDFAGQGWIYKPPAGSSIAGGKVEARLRTRNGSSSVVSIVAERAVSKLCEYPDCEEYEGEVAIPAGASEVYVRASCVATTEPPYVCHPPDESKWEHEGDYPFSAEADISSAEFIFATKATPKGSGFTGSLTGETVSGPGTLSFTATDPGPGVYQVRVKVDGNQVWAETPNDNGGKCAPTGTTAGVRVFDAFQPCPTETAVHAEVHTAILADGTHTVTVEVEDAAGDVSTVYSGTLITLNHPVSTILPPAPAPVRGPANGTPASESAVLGAQWVRKSGKSGNALTSAYGHPREITGKLTNATGTPIADALIEASQKPASLGATASSMTGAHTSSTGAFTVLVPANSPSTSIELAYRSHIGDPRPVATKTFTLRVPASIHLTVSPHLTSVGHTIILRGTLAGSIPPGGKKVLFEARVIGGPWIEFHNATVNAHGRFRATHRFTFPGPISYQFRVVCEREADFPFLAGASNVVDVHER